MDIASKDVFLRSLPPLLSFLTRISQGDAEAVQLCIDEYGDLIWRLASRYLSRTPGEIEDAVQDVFVELWTSAHRFDPARGTEAAFIATIAHRKLIDHQRRMKIRFTVAMDHQPDTPAPTSIEPGRSREHLAPIARAFEQLPPEERTALWMALGRGMSQRQIAQATQSPEGTVKSRLRRGLIKMREFTQLSVPMTGGGLP
jgi:RNA polymerase sigma-70 factor (ECF subfamily)